MSKLAARTRVLLANRSRLVTYAHIAAETGLSPRWLERFASDTASGDFHCGKVEELYEFLTGTPLDV